MTVIESKEVTVKGSCQQTFEFLKNLNNYHLLLPKDRISDWKADEKSCSFRIQNTYTITLVYNGANEPNTIMLISGEGSPLKFNLDLELADANTETTQAKMVCKADLNPFLKMMVEKPLKNLFDYMADRLVKVREEA
jgi:carbon monoxide dehydrogenase subunit G